MKNVSNPEAVDTALAQVVKDLDITDKKYVNWINGPAKRYLLEEVECFSRLSPRDVVREYKEKPWMLKAYPSGSAIYEFDSRDPQFREFVSEVSECMLYLQSLVGQSNLNPVPWDKARTEGHRMVERAKLETMGEQREDKTLIHKFPNGDAWWMLLTEKSLRRESNFMGHCVGRESMGYFGKIVRGEINIYSLRDKNN